MRTFLCQQPFPCARCQYKPGDLLPESDVESARTFEGWSEDFVMQVYPEPEAPPPTKKPTKNPAL